MTVTVAQSACWPSLEKQSYIKYYIIFENNYLFIISYHLFIITIIISSLLMLSTVFICCSILCYFLLKAGKPSSLVPIPLHIGYSPCRGHNASWRVGHTVTIILKNLSKNVQILSFPASSFY